MHKKCIKYNREIKNAKTKIINANKKYSVNDPNLHAYCMAAKLLSYMPVDSFI